MSYIYKQYCDASTVHGIGYIFERGQAFFPRFVWLLFVVASMTLGLLWSSQVRELKAKCQMVNKEIAVSGIL